jgi:heme exporter protein C
MMKVFRWLWLALTLALLANGFRVAMFVVPIDQEQGEISRILYYHVPSWCGMAVFFAVNLICSLVYLALRNKNRERALKADALALASAEMGVVYCLIGMTTGSLWGRAAWGIWWTWDARLTTTLVLWLIYVSYLLLRRFADGPQMQTLASVLGIFGALDVPIVYMSNRWWRTQHPAPVFGGDSSSGMAPSMVGALLWNMLAWFCWGIIILLLRYNVERKHQLNAAAQAREALEANV